MKCHHNPNQTCFLELYTACIHFSKPFKLLHGSTHPPGSSYTASRQPWNLRSCALVAAAYLQQVAKWSRAFLCSQGWPSTWGLLTGGEGPYGVSHLQQKLTTKHPANVKSPEDLLTITSIICRRLVCVVFPPEIHLLSLCNKYPLLKGGISGISQEPPEWLCRTQTLWERHVIFAVKANGFMQIKWSCSKLKKWCCVFSSPKPWERGGFYKAHQRGLMRKTRDAGSRLSRMSYMPRN